MYTLYIQLFCLFKIFQSIGLIGITLLFLIVAKCTEYKIYHLTIYHFNILIFKVVIMVITAKFVAFDVFSSLK